jgi:hypothetical protein
LPTKSSLYIAFQNLPSYKQNDLMGCFMPVNPATQKAETGGPKFEASPRPYLKNKLKPKGMGCSMGSNRP